MAAYGSSLNRDDGEPHQDKESGLFNEPAEHIDDGLVELRDNYVKPGMLLIARLFHR